jgi:uncharacterized integral membrane protein (TIGR00698 family)
VNLSINVKNILPGLGLALGLTIIVYLVSEYTGLNAIILALVLGILVGNMFPLPESTTNGIKFSSGFVLEIAIVLMAFGINYSQFISLGWQTIVIILVSMIVTLWSTLFLAKKLKCPGSTGWLVGFGTAICGSAAIAALAPRISKDKGDMGIAMAIVNLFGLLGMIVLPYFVQEFYGDIKSSVLLGASLHAVGNVAGAGFAVSDAVGEMAVAVKLGRIALLTPALIIFLLFIGKEQGQVSDQKLKLPWFLWVFILISIVVSLVSLPHIYLSTIKDVSGFLLAIAMVGIGLKVNIKTLLKSGKRGLAFGAIIFAIQLTSIIITMYLVL